jgi:hypothetical protein
MVSNDKDDNDQYLIVYSAVNFDKLEIYIFFSVLLLLCKSPMKESFIITREIGFFQLICNKEIIIRNEVLKSPYKKFFRKMITRLSFFGIKTKKMVIYQSFFQNFHSMSRCSEGHSIVMY